MQSVFPEWTDFEVAGFGNVLIEMFSFVGDVLGFYLDNQARESRLSTATQRKNVIALARMLGYRLHGAQAASAELEFKLSRRPSADVTIPKGTIIRTQEVTEPVRFQLTQEVLFKAGTSELTKTGIVEHSLTRTQRFDTQGLADLDLPLNFTPYLDSSAKVRAANGEYLEQPSLLSSGPLDRHFTVLVDQNDRATLRFGDGMSGAMPKGTLVVSYKTGGGPLGNVEAGRLVVLEGVLTDAHGRPVQLSVSNPAPALGGVERQSIASAKLLAPESLRVLNRTVTREDFEINARRVPGVARALMLTSNEDSTIDENSGILYVIPTGGGKPSPGLRNRVLLQVTEVYPCTLTFQISVHEPVYKVVDIAARVYLKQGFAPSVVRDRIRARLAEFFRVSGEDGTPNSKVDFGFNIKDRAGNPCGEVAWSDVFNVIRDTEGVRKMGDRHGDLMLSGLPADVKLTIAEFPILGEVRLINGDTGGLL